ncbi:hypothetical protein K2Z84_02010 [Candidatus Binatia bacterium]|jgi:hypothetical protein|nr:hypothetical protein [Candidatus Binatia bacterium]
MAARGSARRILMVAMITAVTILLLARTPTRVESSEGSMLGAARISPGAGWQQAFHVLAVGP